jgi:hypothetical protein
LIWLFRDGEIGPKRRQVCQSDDRATGIEIAAEIDLAHTELSGEGRADQLLGDLRLRLGDPGFCLVAQALLLVNHLSALEFPRRQLLVAIEIGAGDAGQSLETGQVAAFGRVVELYQRVAGIHFRAGREHDLGDHAADFGSDRHLTNGHERADGRQIFGDRADLRGHSGDRRGRRMESHSRSRRRLVIAVVEDKGGDNGDQHQRGNAEHLELTARRRPVVKRGRFTKFAQGNGVQRHQATHLGSAGAPVIASVNML